MMIVLLLSVISTGEIPSPGITWFDKVEHFMMYMVFTLVVIYDLRKTVLIGSSSRTVFTAAAVFTSLFGGLMEIVQLIPALGRSAEAGDFLANITGAIFSALLYPRIENILNAFSRQKNV